MKEVQLMRVRVQIANCEIEVEATDVVTAEETLLRLWSKLASKASREAISSGIIGDGGFASAPAMSLAELIAVTKPNTGTEKVVVAAFHIEQSKDDASGFSTRDVSTALAEARQKISNPSHFTTNAVKKGLIMESSTKGKWRLTQTGLNWIDQRLASVENENAAESDNNG